ncbi:MAG: hypothetical protein EAZ27_02210 [Cytophagales bacterium]|nr:MAG: hypothetical protein EAZ27_02210 [Cytophagales bacterium]
MVIFKFFLLFFIFLNLNIFGQFKIGANANFTLPTGINNQQIGRGFGIGFNAKYLLTENFAIGGLANYYVFNSQFLGITPTMYTLGGSFDYFFKKSNLTPYIGCDFAYYNMSTSFQGFNRAQLNFSGIGLAPNVGLLYEFSEKWATNFNFKYNHVFSEIYDRQFFTFTVGLVFTIGNNYD